MGAAIVNHFTPVLSRYRRSALDKPPRHGLTILHTDINIPYDGTGAAMATLYGALAMFPLGWATAGYVLVSRAPSVKAVKAVKAQKGTPR
jgi:hypothetical protein